MTIAERIAHASNRLYDTIRSPAARAASEHPGKGNLDPLTGQKHCLVTTFKRSGEPVPTPVWFGLADGRLYFRTYADAVKIKRIRNNAKVLVGPCDPRGKPKGDLIEASARVVSEEERGNAERTIQSNYGLFRRMYKAGFSGRVEDVYVEVTPA